MVDSVEMTCRELVVKRVFGQREGKDASNDISVHSLLVGIRIGLLTLSITDHDIWHFIHIDKTGKGQARHFSLSDRGDPQIWSINMSLHWTSSISVFSLLTQTDVAPVRRKHLRQNRDLVRYVSSSTQC